MMKWRSMVRKLNRLRGANQEGAPQWDSTDEAWSRAMDERDISSSVEIEHCADCEGESVALLGDNGQLYCHDCADDYLNCQRCNQLAIGGRSRVNGRELCAECDDAHMEQVLRDPDLEPRAGDTLSLPNGTIYTAREDYAGDVFFEPDD